jgi:hypothetical protein
MGVFGVWNMAANINPETGVRYGVISGHNAPHLLESIMNNGVDETFEYHKSECVKRLASLLEDMGQRDAEESAKSIVDDFEWDSYESDESEYSYTDAKGNRFTLGYLGGATLIWCIQTDTETYVRSLCSPCVPNAGDLDSGFDPNGVKCYGVPAEYLGDE